MSISQIYNKKNRYMKRDSRIKPKPSFFAGISMSISPLCPNPDPVVYRAILFSFFINVLYTKNENATMRISLTS